MRVLLDTHILLWWLEENPLLTQSAIAVIRDPENTVFISAATLWELRLKQSVGKLRVPDDLERLLAAESFENLPLTAAHTRHVADLPWIHRDPFDRMLIAQAKAENLELLTSDETLEAYGPPVRLVR